MKMRRAMIRKASNILFIILVNLAFFGIILLTIELAVRQFASGEGSQSTLTLFSQRFYPFLMFASQPTEGTQAVKWLDIFRQVDIEAETARNNLGFRMDEDLDFAKRHPKAANERLVLITGGSAVHGVGSTRKDSNIPGRMEAFLNQKQKKYHYKVLNFGIGGGIAYQQFLALNLWGKWMAPDWIVSMDGWNDIAVCCAHSQGPAVPQYYHHMKSYIEGYMTNQLNPPFYRGWIENQLLRYSYAYQRLTGKQYVPRNQYVVFDEGVARIGTEVRWEDIDRQVIFYLHAQESILSVSDSARYILSLQPMALPFTEVFGMSDEDCSLISAEKKGKRAGLFAFYYENALSYFMVKAQKGLNDLMAKYHGKKDVRYFNVGSLFPEPSAQRNLFFIDNMHLNDKGADLVATFFSYQILMRDFPDQASRLMTGMKNRLAEMVVQEVPQPSYVRGIPSASTILNADRIAKNAFDKNEKTFWHSGADIPQWLQIKLDCERAIHKVGIKPATSGGAMVKDFTIKASHDGMKWIELFAGQHKDSGDMEYYSFTNHAAYKYYRIMISSTWREDSHAGIVEVELLESPTPFGTHLDCVATNLVDLDPTMTHF